MATFDVSFLNPNLRKSSSAQDYGFLVDQLDIKQSTLESDGKLSPGDYDLLIEEAQKVYAHPGLTEAQRSNIDVKIARYTRDKEVNTTKDQNDIARLNREVQEDGSKIGLRFSNDPQKFLEATAALQNAKIDQLAAAIDQLEMAGDDSSAHIIELNETLQAYNNTLSALDDVENYAGGAPASNYAAYVVTNSEGEVVDLKVDRVGAQGGYLETNGVYGGLPLYGKVNRKEYGKNVFVLGNQTFSANDVVVPGPDGTLKPSVLISTAQQKNAQGGFSIAESGYAPVDLAGVRPQSAVRTGGWIEGEKGFLYQKQADGSYIKYFNADKEQLGITDHDIIRVPRSMEQSILGSVAQTVDGSDPINLPQPTTLQPQSLAPNTGPATDTPGAPQQPQQKGIIQRAFDQAVPAAVSAVNPALAPVVRAANNAPGIAGQALDAAKGFFGKVFGG